MFISHCFGHCPSPLLQAMLKAPAMILGVKGPSNQRCSGGEGGGCANLRCFCESVPRLLARIIDTYLKGLCHGFLASVNSQNIYLCRRKPTNNGLFLLTIAIFRYAETVSKCLWLQMARMETDCNLKIEAKLFKSFPLVFQ